ncbi:phosphotransferase [Kribbella sp. NPDC023855]|uniref:phosphotransferase enzyme family protein n=1 Tax=Kribbella sp. NPDC023855 TaxID=3154698 RepID=UPI0033DAA0E5
MLRADATALAELFGVGEPSAMQETARGAMGAVWRLETETGTYAAKELFWFEGDVGSVRREVAFRTACAAAGVRSPEPLASVSGEYVVRHEGVWWRLYEWAEGDVPDHLDIEVTTWLAQQMAVIHALDWPGGELEPVPFYHQVDVDWDELVDTALRAGVEWADDLRRAQPQLLELTSLVNAEPVGDQVWCHRDLKNSNVLRPASNVAEGNWLVDWDNVGPLSPERELGALLMWHLHNPADLRRLVTGYHAAGGPAEITGPASFATGLAISLNFLHGQAALAMDTGHAETHRRYATRQVAGVISGLPDLAQLKTVADVSRT